MNDLFEREQNILEIAKTRLREAELKKECSVEIEIYAELVNEYHRLLRQLRRVTKLSDKTTVDLNASKLNLQDKIQYDELTGIYNRRFLDENLEQVIHMLRLKEGVLSILMADVDFFKRYNDTYGHGAGDQCLKIISGCLKDTAEDQHSFAARYGGEEFVIVLPNAEETKAKAVAQNILKHILECRIPHERNTAAEFVTISLGVTTGRVTEATAKEHFLQQADKALYQSKQNGRNKYTFIRLEMEAAE